MIGAGWQADGLRGLARRGRVSGVRERHYEAREQGPVRLRREFGRNGWRPGGLARAGRQRPGRGREDRHVVVSLGWGPRTRRQRQAGRQSRRAAVSNAGRHPRCRPLVMLERRRAGPAGRLRHWQAVEVQGWVGSAWSARRGRGVGPIWEGGWAWLGPLSGRLGLSERGDRCPGRGGPGRGGGRRP